MINLEDEEEVKEVTQPNPVIEAEIQNLFGSLRIRASDIKATLLKTKT
jgi:hypothetical protein